MTIPDQSTQPEQSDSQPLASAAGAAEPMRGYIALASAFLGLTCAALLWVRRKRLVLPKPDALDTALIALATARLSRLVTRDKVMRPLRAPFTVIEGDALDAPKEHARGSGLRRAAGELVTCPRCTAIWAASGLCLTYFASPSTGRFAGMVLSSSLISDLVNRKFALLSQESSSHAARA